MTPRIRLRLPVALAVAFTLALAAPAIASAAYGAIAVNPSTGQWGLSYRAPAKWYAKRCASAPASAPSWCGSMTGAVRW